MNGAVWDRRPVISANCGLIRVIAAPDNSSRSTMSLALICEVTKGAVEEWLEQRDVMRTERGSVRGFVSSLQILRFSLHFLNCLELVNVLEISLLFSYFIFISMRFF